jgi:hypothetical protein
MNAFFEHHQHSIRLAYRCFDRLLLNGLIQPFQQPERVIGFFNRYREGKRVTRDLLHEISDQFKNWVTNRSKKWKAPIVEAPKVVATTSWTLFSSAPRPMKSSPS